jgi:hypothetical protein
MSVIEDLKKKINTDVSGKWIQVGELEKFAELIVQECMSNLYLHGYDDAVVQIQKHFGVEE